MPSNFAPKYKPIRTLLPGGLSEIRVNILAIIALLFSLWIYRDYRSSDTLVNALSQDLGIGKFLAFHSLNLPSWMIYNLPEALWVFAVTLWSYRRKMKVLHWRISLQYIPLIYPIALELFQYWHITDGRFDLLDILASTVGWAMAMLLSNSYSSRSWHHGQGHFILLLYAMVILSDVV